MTQLTDLSIESVTAILGVVVASSVLVSVIVKVWPFITRLVSIVNDLSGESPRPGVPARPGIMERLHRLETQSDTERDHHQSMLDGVNRVEAKVEILSTRLDEFTIESIADRKALWALAQHHHRQEHDDDQTDNP